MCHRKHATEKHRRTQHDLCFCVDRGQTAFTIPRCGTEAARREGDAARETAVLREGVKCAVDSPIRTQV
jgi:hypothetical protein